MQPTPGSSVYEPIQCVLKRIRAVLTTNLQFINTNWHSHVHNNSRPHRLHYRIYTPKHAWISWWMPYSSYVRTTYVCPWDSTPSTSPLTRFLRFSSLYREWDVAGRIIDKDHRIGNWLLVWEPFGYSSLVTATSSAHQGTSETAALPFP